MNAIQALLDLQETDGSIRELQQLTKDIPIKIAHERARLTGSKKNLELVSGQLAKVKASIQEDEQEAATIRSRIQELKIAQTSISSNKEMQQSIMQIEMLEHDADGVENHALEITEAQLPRFEKAVEEAQAVVDEETAVVEAGVKDLEEMLAQMNGDLQVQMGERKAKAEQISAQAPRSLLIYERTRTKRWPAVVMLNEDGVCEGCHMKQPQFVTQNAIRQSNAINAGKSGDLVMCTMCGRILYREA